MCLAGLRSKELWPNVPDADGTRSKCGTDSWLLYVFMTFKNHSLTVSATASRRSPAVASRPSSCHCCIIMGAPTGTIQAWGFSLQAPAGGKWGG
jgi:hypothetical protein